MKNKRLVKYFFALSIALLLVLPIINIIDFSLKHSFSEMKKIDKKIVLNIDKIETLVSYVVYKVFDQSFFPDTVITGKDGFFFLGNRYREVLNQTNNTFPVTDVAIENFVEKLHELQSWYESKGIKFIIAIAPNKHTVYKDKLPNWIDYNGKTITDRIVNKSKEYNINLVDLRSVVLKAKENEERLLYQKTDTHWNMLGASFGYEKIIDYMNIKYKMHIPKAKYEVKHNLEENHKGGLFKFLKASDIFKIQDYNTYYYDFGNDAAVCHGQINIENGNLENCKIKNNPVMATNWQPQYSINKRIPKEKLLFLADSFSTAPSQLYNMSFNIVLKLHFRKFKGEWLKPFIEKNKPDIVLYQTVERDLYSNMMFNILNKGE